MPLPSSVAEVSVGYQRQQQVLTREAVSLVSRALARASSPTSWRDGVAAIGTDLLDLQAESASLADLYLSDILQAQGADASAAAAVSVDGFTDFTEGGGSWLHLMVFAPNSVNSAARDLVAHSIAMNGIQDVARASVQAGMQARPAVSSYVRQLSPPSCSRCAILAGRVYHSMTAFDRHPRCDCVNVPAAESAEDWTTSPHAYFHSLSTSDQEAVFGEAGARAIRDGADISQVVNAQEGMTTVTARSFAGQQLGLRNGQTAVRLLPDQIYQLAAEENWDRAEVLRQLQRFGYLI